MPQYLLDDLVAACGRGTAAAWVTRGAVIEAATLGYYHGAEILRFIARPGLEDPHFHKSDPWRNNPDPSRPIFCDVYFFFSGPKYGYLSFFFNPDTGIWTIKSFKRNDRDDPRDSAVGIIGSAHVRKLNK